MAYCADMLDYYAGLVVDGSTKERRAPPPAAYELDAACTIATYPAGVAALVTPWNYPLLQAVLKVAPAVAAGCPFVLKPSPLASLTCVDFLQTILGPLTPPGACNLLTGGPPLSGADRGAGALLADPRVAVCSFTGSSRGGEAVLNAAAPAGGHRRWSSAARARSSSSTTPTSRRRRTRRWSGSCPVRAGVLFSSCVYAIAATRPSHRRRGPGLLRDVSAVDPAADLRRCRRTSPREDGRRRRRQAARPAAATSREQQLVSAGVSSTLPRHRRDSSLASSSGRGGPRSTCASLRPRLTVAACLRRRRLSTGDLEGAEVWREEVFGPVLCAMPFESDEDAIKLANASRFGLAHAVFSADEARAAKCADALDAGVVWVNANQILWPDTPFGGWKA